MSHSVSILIPTHDRAEILDRSLESVRALHLPEDVSVEAVVIANACTDATEDTVRAKTDTFPFPLRLIVEPVPGLNAARNTGARAARSELLAYLDDDAFVEPGWLLGLLRTFEEVPADLVAGKVLLWWETVERPSWSSPAVETLLSCLDLGDDVRGLLRPGLLVGANFAVRRSVVEGLGGFAPNLDRAGADLLSGGDTELAVRAQEAGYRLYYSPEMAVRHWVAPSRVSFAYLDRVARARGRTQVVLADRRGGRRHLGLVRSGLGQMLQGGWAQLRFGIVRDRRRAVAGRLARMRGLGRVEQVLRSVLAGRGQGGARAGAG